MFRFSAVPLTETGAFRSLTELSIICLAPTDIPAIKGVDPATGEEVERHSSDSEPFAALAFKIMNDPFVGKLAFFRVYSGTCEAGS